MRLKHYTMEEIEGKELVSLDINEWRDTYEVKPITISRTTSKTIYYVNTRGRGAQIRIRDMGYKSYSAVICLKEDVPALVGEYKQRKLGEYLNDIENIKEKITLIENLKEEVDNE